MNRIGLMSVSKGLLETGLAGYLLVTRSGRAATIVTTV